MADFFVHPTSVVESGARIGAGTRIWLFCHIMPDAEIGKNCQLGQNVFIDNGARIGNNVKIQNNVSIYNKVVLEDDVFVGPSAVFTNVVNPRSFIDRKEEFKDTLIRRGATIGANATIVCGIEVGAYALVGAGAVVIENIPPYTVVAGNPARVIGKTNKEGELGK